jgi:DNA polymerase
VFREVDADPSKPDLYTRTAAQLSHVEVAAVTKPMRQRGKVAELALGYGGGLGALQSMGAGYGLRVDAKEGREIVAKWRAANSWCVAFWGSYSQDESCGLWGAAHRALKHPGQEFSAGRVSYVFMKDQFDGALFCKLPSGRCLTYRGARYERMPVLDDDDNVVGYENVLRFMRGYGRVKLWPGMLCENCVQAVAADYLRGTLRRLEFFGAPVRLHTHDEVLLEVPAPKAEQMRALLRKIMLRPFPWSDGLPLMSEETVASYYTKQETAHELTPNSPRIHPGAEASRPARLPAADRSLFIRA